VKDKDLLRKLHTLAVQKIIQKLESDEFTAADMTAAINMLKHNGINADPAQTPDLQKAKQLVDRTFGGPEDLSIN
jgi:hypothetical protein